MTKPTPRKMRYPSGQVHNEDRKWCPECGCVPVEPEPSRSVQRRVAVQKGEPVPTFEPQEPVAQPESPTKLSPEKQLENLYDALAESITNASPEEITAEMTPEDVVKAQELKAKMLEWVDEYKVIEWLRERHANCLSIAAQKTGEDRGGWMEDAKNFEATIRLCVKRVAQPMPEFDCHFSDIRQLIEAEFEDYDESTDEHKFMVRVLAKLEEKYGRKA